jgi:hypothetical protein
VRIALTKSTTGLSANDKVRTGWPSSRFASGPWPPSPCEFDGTFQIRVKVDDRDDPGLFRAPSSSADRNRRVLGYSASDPEGIVLQDTELDRAGIDCKLDRVPWFKGIDVARSNANTARRTSSGSTLIEFSRFQEPGPVVESASCPVARSLRAC